MRVQWCGVSLVGWCSDAVSHWYEGAEVRCLTGMRVQWCGVSLV